MTTTLPRRTAQSLAHNALVLAVMTCLISFGNSAFACSRISAAFIASPRRAHRSCSTSDAMQQTLQLSASNRQETPWQLAFSKDDSSSWEEEHLIHGSKEIHEETDEELKEAEEMAAWDAHDASSDPGMEAASEERAVMLAHEIAHKLKEKAQHAEEKKDEWNEEHMIHGAQDIHEETDEELKESEEAAVWDAYDSASDPGMEAAMMERSVMLANEMAHKMKEKAEHAHDDDEQK